ncbi:hypothetical protein [Parasphingorhabdus sp.]|uniref:hypothetical protein n=1 Tax=Parasphingorhabdus sp. TaxID=2709688 RepID=UPI003A955F5A
MMEKLQKRGVDLAEQRLDRVKSEIKSVLAEELPGDARVTETTKGIEVEACRLGEQLIENSSLRDVAFLMRAVR